MKNKILTNKNRMKLIENLKINKRGDFGIRAYFLAFLFFGAVITIFALMVSSTAEQYNTESIIDEEFKSKYSSFNNFTGKINDITNTLSTPEGINILNIGYGVFQAVYSFFQLTLSSFGLISTSTENFASDFTIPKSISGIIFALFLAGIMVTIAIRILNSTNPNRI